MISIMISQWGFEGTEWEVARVGEIIGRNDTSVLLGRVIISPHNSE